MKSNARFSRSVGSVRLSEERHHMNLAGRPKPSIEKHYMVNKDELPFIHLDKEKHYMVSIGELFCVSLDDIPNCNSNPRRKKQEI